MKALSKELKVNNVIQFLGFRTDVHLLSAIADIGISSSKHEGHIITVFEDGFHQEFVIIDNDESKLYDSIADAKRVIRGEQPYYEIN
jgi:hypothetical protein